MLTLSLLAAVVVGTVQAVLVYWQFVQWPVLITPMFLFVAAVMGSELSRGLLRAARAERDVQIKGAALDMSEQRLSLAAEAVDAGFWSLDVQSGDVWATAKTRELFGLAPGGELHLAQFLERVRDLGRPLPGRPGDRHQRRPGRLLILRESQIRTRSTCRQVAARNSIGIVLVGGLFISTLFTLFVVPTIYMLVARDHSRDREDGTAVPET